MREGRDGGIIDDYRESYWWLRDNTPEDARVMSWWCVLSAHRFCPSPAATLSCPTPLSAPRCATLCHHVSHCPYAPPLSAVARYAEYYTIRYHVPSCTTPLRHLSFTETNMRHSVPSWHALHHLTLTCTTCALLCGTVPYLDCQGLRVSDRWHCEQDHAGGSALGCSARLALDA